eukprot:Nk52_evm26s2309 gene=Nk52_evmTU26s2309
MSVMPFEFHTNSLKLSRTNSEDTGRVWEELLNEAKTSVKALLGYGASNVVIHQTHSDFISLCKVVEKILDHGLKGDGSLLRDITGSPPRYLESVWNYVKKLEQICGSQCAKCFEYVQEEMEMVQKNKGKKYRDEVARDVAKVQLWISFALLEKQLGNFLTILVNDWQHTDQYYEKWAFMQQSDQILMFTGLIDGLNALEFTRYYSVCDELSAEDLIERHRFPRANSISIADTVVLPYPVRRFSTRSNCSGFFVGNSPLSISPSSSPQTRGPRASEEESLQAHLEGGHYEVYHNDPEVNLLFGKNNVSVESKGKEESLGYIKGYLSVHQLPDKSIKLSWTPNALIGVQGPDIENSPLRKYVIQIDIEDMEALFYDEFELADGTPVEEVEIVDSEGDNLSGLIFAKETAKAFIQFLATIVLLRKFKNGSGYRVMKKAKIRSFEPNSPSSIVRTKLAVSGSEEEICVSDDDTASRTSEESEDFVEIESHTIVACVFQTWLEYTRLNNMIVNELGSLLAPEEQTMERANVNEEDEEANDSGMDANNNDVKKKRKAGGTSSALSLIADDEIKMGLTEELLNKLVNKDENLRSDSEMIFRKAIYYGGLQVESKRKMVWKYLLGLYKYGMTRQEKEEQKLEAQKSYRSAQQKWMAGFNEGEKFAQFLKERIRIDKDIERCDRHTVHFAGRSFVQEQNRSRSQTVGASDSHFVDPDINLDAAENNLEILRNLMYAYVFGILDFGYVQGMVDLIAPVHVVMKSESETYSYFVRLMTLMQSNFSHDQAAITSDLNNLKHLLQILKPELFYYLKSKDSDHLLFCYRWLLLRFKREFNYEGVFAIWEADWAALSTKHFYLFVAVAILDQYEMVIMDNNMGFDRILKFFNELSQKMDHKVILERARFFVTEVARVVKTIQKDRLKTNAKTADVEAFSSEAVITL